MVGWLSIGLVLIVIFLASVKIAGKRGRLLGKSDERRMAAEAELARIDRALEDLAAPPPDRDGLARRWMRRMQKSEDDLPPVPDSD